MTSRARQTCRWLFALLSGIFLADSIIGWSHLRIPPFSFDPVQPFSLVIAEKSNGYWHMSQKTMLGRSQYSVTYYQAITSIEETGRISQERYESHGDMMLMSSEIEDFGMALKDCRVSRLKSFYNCVPEHRSYLILWIRQRGSEKIVILFNDTSDIDEARNALFRRFLPTRKTESSKTTEIFTDRIDELEEALERTHQTIEPFVRQKEPSSIYSWFQSV